MINNTALTPQTSEFTCGPAALLTAIKHIDPSYLSYTEEEFAIWHEANTIFMGDGHPGCSCYGLALAALRRGFKAKINLNLNGDTLLFSDWLGNDQFYAVHKWLETRFRSSFLSLSGQEDCSSLTFDRLVEQIDAGFIAVMLTSLPDDRAEGHWVCVMNSAPSQLTYFDPYDSIQDISKLQPLSRTLFEQLSEYGELKKRAVIYLCR
jgi:hypothetical protein